MLDVMLCTQHRYCLPFLTLCPVQEDRERLLQAHLSPGAYELTFKLVERAAERVVFDRAGTQVGYYTIRAAIGSARLDELKDKHAARMLTMR